MKKLLLILLCVLCLGGCENKVDKGEYAKEMICNSFKIGWSKGAIWALEKYIKTSNIEDWKKDMLANSKIDCQNDMEKFIEETYEN